jgi:hypothetical protein
MRRPRILVPILSALAVAAGCGGMPTAPGGGADPAVVVDLKAVPSADESFDSQFTRLDASGKGSIPFANAEGKLLVKAAGKKVRLDSNGDGVVDDKDAPAVPAGETVKVRFLLGGTPAEYPIRIEAVEDQYVVLGSCLVLEGTLDGCTIRLFDAEVDGTFATPGEDTVAIVEPGKDAAAPDAAEAPPLPLGRILSVKGRLVEATPSGGGTRLTCRPYAGETALLVVKPGAGVESCSLQLAHVDGLQYVRIGGPRPVRLVPGTYRIAQSEMEVRPGRDAAAARKAKGDAPAPDADTLCLSGVWDFTGSEGPTLTVRAGPQEIVPGPPFRLAFDAGRASGRKDRVEIREPRLVGAAGEWYMPSVSVPGGGESTLTSHVRAGAREQKLSTLEFG